MFLAKHARCLQQSTSFKQHPYRKKKHILHYTPLNIIEDIMTLGWQNESFLFWVNYPFNVINSVKVSVQYLNGEPKIWTLSMCVVLKHGKQKSSVTRREGVWNFSISWISGKHNKIQPSFTQSKTAFYRKLCLKYLIYWLLHYSQPIPMLYDRTVFKNVICCYFVMFGQCFAHSNDIITDCKHAEIPEEG